MGQQNHALQSVRGLHRNGQWLGTQSLFRPPPCYLNLHQHTMSSPSLLPFVKAADSFPDYISQPSAYPLKHPETGEVYVPFHLCPSDFDAKLTPLGLLRPNVVEELQAFEAESRMGAFNFVKDGDAVKCVTFTEPVVAQGTESMNQAVASAAWMWRRAGKFKNELDGESDRGITELFNI